jgi:ribA/ribD-fused uncharacterized protein
VIDDTTYTTKTLHTLPPDLDPALIATQSIGELTAFFSKASPLSNFYPAPIVINSRKYSCVEQYFQASKAIFAERPDIAAKICETDDPAICKRLGDQIAVDLREWLPRAKEEMRHACRCKFSTHERPRRFLLDSGISTIVEAGPDTTWGAGLRMTDPKLKDKSNWKGKNILGDILMSIRDEMR